MFSSSNVAIWRARLGDISGSEQRNPARRGPTLEAHRMSADSPRWRAEDRLTLQSYCDSVSKSQNVKWTSQHCIRVGGLLHSDPLKSAGEVRRRRRLRGWRSSGSTLSLQARPWPRAGSHNYYTYGDRSAEHYTAFARTASILRA